MLIPTLQSLFTRDLNRLKAELEQYQTESNIWLMDKAIPNSAGNLALHLVGNLNAFIGAQLGKTGYIRDRPLEFSAKGVPRAELISKIEETITAVEASLGKLTEEGLQLEYPQTVMPNPVTTDYFLVHLAMHLSYHLGQVNYHRRLLDN